MKIPFDIKYKPQIESGEYKVETGSKEPVAIIKWDLKNYDGNILCYYSDGKEEIPYVTNGEDLFIITSELKLSEFEDRLVRAFCEVKTWNDIPVKEYTKVVSSELLELARNQLQKEGLVTMEHMNKACEAEYQSGLADGKNEAMKEIEQDPESSYAFKRGVEYGKEEALKDLPRWEKCVSSFVYGYVDNGVLFYKYRYIHLSDLEKLSGFKEDEK